MTRNLCLVFGDQLSEQIASLKAFDPTVDVVWMAEAEEEATHVWCHKQRLVLFFSAMRHFRDALREGGWSVDYHELTHRRSDDRGPDFATLLRKAIHRLGPERIIMTQPGDYRVQEAVVQQVAACEKPLEIREDRHFLCRLEDFQQWAEGRKRFMLEDFYRWMRRTHKILLDDEGKPVGGRWNFDADNRQAFGKSGPPAIAEPRGFDPDAITREVMEMVEKRFADHPGRLEGFSYPVTASQAAQALEDFITHRLEKFGDYQDALWIDQAFLFHSRLSAVMNLHLLDPRDCLDAAVGALQSGRATLNSVEGFVRQILGWREYVRGVYWRWMPEYIERNALACEDRDVPGFFWDGKTEMRCVADSLKNVREKAYAHHIQRLMVLGLYAQLEGVHPRRFHDWHMAMYADAIDWVSLPNTLGMSQFGDGGVVGTKPYCASGNYVNKMSNYCQDCRYNHRQAVGEEACPLTTLYWDFLDRHRDAFAGNRRMVFQIKNLEKKSDDEMRAIRARAERLRQVSRESNEAAD